MPNPFFPGLNPYSTCDAAHHSFARRASLLRGARQVYLKGDKLILHILAETPDRIVAMTGFVGDDKIVSTQKTERSYNTHCWMAKRLVEMAGRCWKLERSESCPC